MGGRNCKMESAAKRLKGAGQGILLFLILLCLSSCGKENTVDISKLHSPVCNVTEEQAGIEMKTERIRYKTGADKIGYRIFNNTERRIEYGMETHIQICVDGTWYQIDWGRAFPLIAYIIEPHRDSGLLLFGIDYTVFHWPPGEYRLVRTVEQDYCCAYFELA
ncbi:MAG: hypothetical protein GX111_09700 [Clostridiales bacterium]|nr:hypothetical protein [Clostridiales bacterium]